MGLHSNLSRAQVALLPLAFFPPSTDGVEGEEAILARGLSHDSFHDFTERIRTRVDFAFQQRTDALRQPLGAPLFGAVFFVVDVLVKTSADFAGPSPLIFRILGWFFFGT